ncbi:MAG: SDR family oxidoreductase [Pseudomonadota bacterium]
MLSSLNGKIILVTGAAGGIGSAICSALSDHGATVIATDREAPGELSAHACWALDASSEVAWETSADRIANDYGRLDGLVNNAATCTIGPLEQTDLALWRDVQAINVESVLLSLKTMLPPLKVAGASSGAGASVVNVSSVGGLRGAAFMAAYCASKAAITSLTKSAAHEFGALQHNIRVNSVHPGGVDTPMLESIASAYVELGIAPTYERAIDTIESRHVLGRLAQPAEIAGGVVYLCSDQASFVTGSELVIDGGFTSI